MKKDKLKMKMLIKLIQPTKYKDFVELTIVLGLFYYIYAMYIVCRKRVRKKIRITI
jgi:hypothetical protein